MQTDHVSVLKFMHIASCLI